MEDAALRLGVEQVRSLLALGPDDVVVVVEDQDRVLEHHVVLGHGVPVPCAGGGGRRLGSGTTLGWSRGGLGCRSRSGGAVRGAVGGGRGLLALLLPCHDGCWYRFVGSDTTKVMDVADAMAANEAPCSRASYVALASLAFIFLSCGRMT